MFYTGINISCSCSAGSLLLVFWLSLHLRLSMMDLLVAMAPSVDEATMTKTFELIRPYLEVRI